MDERGEGGGGRRPVTLDQLIALNDEILALARAGVPLERGLRAAGSDLPGRLGELARGLGDRMERGESLADAIKASGAGIPPVYRAVIEAGLRTGRLSNALEGLATYARGFAEARRSVVLALWYPLLVLFLASVLFLGIVTAIIPRFVAAFGSLGLSMNAPMRLLNALSAYAWYWGPVVPTAVLVVVAGMVLSGRAGAFGGRGPFGFLRWMPWTGPMLRGFEAASFADMLALLVEHGLPYPEALVLAGDASGDPALAASSRDLAAALERGAAPAEALRGPSAFPPLLRWVLAGGRLGGDVPSALRQMARRYRERARYQSEALRVMLPTALLFGIGASATLLYALALFVPLTTLWRDLSMQAP